jgi:predicted dehydrogenase
MARLVAVADLDLQRAEAAKQAWGFQAACRDYRELLERDDVDLISVCTRPNIHGSLVSEAVKAGKHVLCEKPLAHTLADADSIIATCDAHPESKVSCVYQWRTDPSLLHLKKLIEEGHLGRPMMGDLHVRSSRPAEYFKASLKRGSWSHDGGGQLIVIAIHHIDSLVDLLGEAVEVSAQMATFEKRSEGDDTLIGWVRFKNGALVTLRTTVCDVVNQFTLNLLSENAMVDLHGGHRGGHPSPAVTEWKLTARNAAAQRAFRQLGFSRSPSLPRELPRQAHRVKEILCRIRRRPWLPPNHWWHIPFVRRFLEEVRDGKPISVDPRDARRSLDLTIGLYQSALFNTVVRLPLDESSPIYSGVDMDAISRSQRS